MIEILSSIDGRRMMLHSSDIISFSEAGEKALEKGINAHVIVRRQSTYQPYRSEEYYVLDTTTIPTATKYDALKFMLQLEAAKETDG